jgi:hypothetical protein
MVAGASCPIQSQDRPADAATSLALLTWIWQLASRHRADAPCGPAVAEPAKSPFAADKH